MSTDELAEKAAQRVREIIAEAEAEAARIREAAEREAAEIRATADTQASSQLERARSAMAELESALGGLGSGLVEQLGGRPKPSAEPDAAEDREVAAHPPTIPEAEDAAAQSNEDSESAEPAAGGGDAAAARLVAMKMALEGKSRDEIAERLTTFDLTDSAALLDDVLKRAKR